MATNGGFLNPPPSNSSTQSNLSLNKVYALNDQIAITWETSSQSYAFQLYQELPESNAVINGTQIFSTTYAPATPTQTQSFNWTVSIYPFNLTSYPVFYIQCADVSGKSLFQTQSFNVTNATEPSPSSIAPPPVSTARSSGLSRGAQAGIAIAVAVVALGLIAVAFACGHCRGRRKRKPPRIVRGGGGDVSDIEIDNSLPPGSSYSNQALRDPHAIATEIYTASLSVEADSKHIAAPVVREHRLNLPPPPPAVLALQDIKTPAPPLRPPRSRYNVRSPEPGYHEVEGSEAPIRTELP